MPGYFRPAAKPSTHRGSACIACRRLDGIPLAIELAAARVKTLAPRQIALRLDQRFRLLTGGDPSALPRQQTMTALIDWSYNLLTLREQAFFKSIPVSREVAHWRPRPPSARSKAKTTSTSSISSRRW